MTCCKYDYFYENLLEFARNLPVDGDPKSGAFADLLELIVDAIREIETGERYKHASAIDAVFSFLKADPVTLYKAKVYDEIYQVMSKLPVKSK